MSGDYFKYQPFVEVALKEDMGRGDVTTNLLFPHSVRGEGVIRAGGPGVMAGGPVAALVFRTLDPGCTVKCVIGEGTPFGDGGDLVLVRGDVRAILSGERVALNILQRMCGIATETKKFVEKIRGFPTVILDTRKTPPGWRELDKYAVRCGGGCNHRFGLDDGILIKDNHLALLELSEAIRRAKASAPLLLKVEVEVGTFEEAREAIEGGADLLLLDNMPCSEMKRVAEWNRGRVFLEASGGITLENVRETAASGVDFISVGELTHSVRAVDLSLDVKKGMSDR